MKFIPVLCAAALLVSASAGWTAETQFLSGRTLRAAQSSESGALGPAARLALKTAAPAGLEVSVADVPADFRAPFRKITKPLTVYVASGALSVELKGKAPETVAAGDTFRLAKGAEFRITGGGQNAALVIAEENGSELKAAETEILTVIRNNRAASRKVGGEHFTGPARAEWFAAPTDSSRVYSANVTFEPCSRTDWHSHPAGQTLYVLSGRGYVQDRGGKRIAVSAGDLLYTPPDVEHWHGAAADAAMTHLAISERIPGKSVRWLEKVSDETYGDAPSFAAPYRLKHIALVSAFTAGGNIPELKEALAAALDAGVTKNEIREVLLQMSAYAGFPRALNGIMAFAEVSDARAAKGIKDAEGRKSTPVKIDKDRYEYGLKVLDELQKRPADAPKYAPRYAQEVPAIDEFLKEHLFADIFSRDGLNRQTREAATVGALTNLGGASGQLRGHMQIALNQGITPEQMKDLLIFLSSKVGQPKGDAALAILEALTKPKKP